MQVKYTNIKKGLVSLSAAVFVVAGAHAQTLPAPDTIEPGSFTGYPASFAEFNLSMSSADPSADAPQICEWTRQNNPGDTMALTGYNLGSEFLFHDGSVSALGLVQTVDSDEAAITLPLSLPADSFYLLWNKNVDGYGKPVPVNGTQAWWLGPSKAARGETFSIFGENLDLYNGQCHAFIEGYGWITSDTANPYKANFTVPSDLGNGTYTVWAHNGFGRQYGWDKSLSLTVYNGLTWNDDPGTWLYVQRDFGATGDGATDDSAAIKSALSAADNTKWSTVYFEPGTYRINSSISDSLTNVRMLGASSAEVILVEKVGGLGNDLLDLNADECEISDITVQTDATSINNSTLLDLVGSENLVLRNLLVSQLPNAALSPAYADPLKMTEEYLVQIIDCTFYTGSTILMKNSDQVFIKGCDFRALNDANSILSFGAAAGISVENTTCGHYDFDAGVEFTGAGRYVLCNPGKGAPRNWYYGNNETIDFTTHTDNNNHNAAEDFLFENTDIEWYSSPVSVNGNVLTFADLPSAVEGNNMYWKDYTAMIVAGKGLGQARTVVDYDTGDNTLTLDEPFLVQPDSSSVIQFGFQARNIAIYDSHFDGNWSRVNHGDDPADAGVETYGAAHRVIVDSNVFTDKETAFYVYSGAKPTVYTGENTPRPNYFGVYKNNLCTNTQTSTRYITTEHNTTLGDPLSPGVGHLGHVFRRNHFANTTEHIWHYEWRETHAGISLTVFDRNTATDFADDVHFRAVHGGTGDGNTVPDGIEKQILLSAYVDGSSPPPPTEPPAPVLTSITITGPSQVNEGGSAVYSCTASYSDGTSASVVPTWSEDSSAASISSSGLLSAFSVDSDTTVTVTATYSGQTDTHVVTVKNVPPVLSHLVISGPSSLDEETTAQYSCTAHYSDGTTLAVNPTWSENRSATTISSSGLLTAGNISSDISVIVTASYGGESATYSVTVLYVPPVLTGLTITGPVTVDEGNTAQYSCVGNYSDGTTAVVDPTWGENSPSASISASGLLTAGNVSSDESVIISASLSGLTASYTAIIKDVAPSLTGISISGPSTVTEGTTAQYSCTANYSDGSSAGVTPSWSITAGSASINAGGLLTAGDVSTDETETITASYGGLTATHNVTISYVPPTVTSITISGPAQVDEETSAQYTCTAAYSDGTTATVTPSWSVNSVDAGINTGGLLTAGDVDVDTAVVITATFSGQSDTHSVLIKYIAPPVTITGLILNGPSALFENSATNYTCSAVYSDGTTNAVAPTWYVDSASASIGAGGVLTAGNIEADLDLTIQASYAGMAATKDVTVWVVGTRVTYPLEGFDGKQIRADLWDETAQTTYDLGEMNSPTELVIENVTPDQWYRVDVYEYEGASDTWLLVHSNWISM
jgi:hypothetical protein